MTLDVRSAKKSEARLLDALMQQYLSEFATFEHVETDEHGKYVYPYLAHYWEDPNRYPFLLRVAEAVAGFALLRFEVDAMNGREVMDVAEFFVLPEHRRQGIGTGMATWLWNHFPGRWHVRVLTSNRNAYPFWKNAIAGYTGGNFNEQAPATAIGGSYLFVFESAAAGDLPDDIEPDVVDY